MHPVTRMMRPVLRGFGSSMRMIGRAVDDFGARLQGQFAYYETVSRQQQFIGLGKKNPSIGDSAFVAPNASLIGDVTLGNNSSVWYGAIVRGDVNKVTIGDNTNIQDRAIIHVAKNPESAPTKIGNSVSIGHRAVVHAATIEDESVVGMGAIVMDKCVVEKNAYIAPGSVVLPGTKVNSGELWAGSPAKMIRKLKPEEIEKLSASAKDYLLLSEAHNYENTKEYDRIEFDRLKRKILETRTPEFQAAARSVGLEDEQSEMQARMDLETRKRHFGG